jgi:hypothetical protein
VHLEALDVLWLSRCHKIQSASIDEFAGLARNFLPQKFSLGVIESGAKGEGEPPGERWFGGSLTLPAFVRYCLVMAPLSITPIFFRCGFPQESGIHINAAFIASSDFSASRAISIRQLTRGFSTP